MPAMPALPMNLPPALPRLPANLPATANTSFASDTRASVADSFSTDYMPQIPAMPPAVVAAAQAGDQSQPPPVAKPVNTLSASSSSSSSSSNVMAAAREFLSTEKTYIKGLKVLVVAYIAHLRGRNELSIKPAVLAEDEIRELFSNIEDIFTLNTKLYNELKLLFNGQGQSPLCLAQGIGRVMRKYIPFLKLYTFYVTQYDNSSKLLVELKKSRPLFKQFVELEEHVANSGTLESLLITPVQRMGRYVLLLDTLNKFQSRLADEEDVQTTPRGGGQDVADTQDDGAPPRSGGQDLEHALIAMKEIAKDINDTVAQWISRQKVMDIQDKFSTLQLVQPDRLHIRDGPLNKLFSKSLPGRKRSRVCWFFLFNNLLFYAIPKGQSFEFKYSFDLINVTVSDIPDGKYFSQSVNNAFKISYVSEDNSSHRDIVLMASSALQKREWLIDLTAAISELGSASVRS